MSLLTKYHSAFFARPISIAVIFERTHWQRSPDSPPQPLKQATPEVVASASVDTPIIQTRQVHLQCSGKVVCIATSTVRMTSSHTAQLFLVDKYAIGQTFRRMEKLPAFDLVSVGLAPYGQDDCGVSPSALAPVWQKSDESRELWRRYKLTTPGFDCDIVEVFPDRDMFLHGEAWLDDHLVFDTMMGDSFYPVKASLRPRPRWFLNSSNTSFLFPLGFFLILFYEISFFMTGGRKWF
jgi:hypothetical protein